MYQLTKKPQLKTATWAGGTTTQLAIFPESATYRQFNFDFRISYATVEVGTSTFTFMPGVTRHLMILKGALEINHTGRYKKHLHKFEQDVFNGEWPTTAKGKVTDFNLMTRGAASGKLESLLLEPDKTHSQMPDEKDFTGIYILKGTLKITYNKEELLLEEGDFILFSSEKTEAIKLKAIEACEMVISKMNLGL